VLFSASYLYHRPRKSEFKKKRKKKKRGKKGEGEEKRLHMQCMKYSLYKTVPVCKK
jgi:hypothetical protein